MLAVQADKHLITTIESVGEQPEPGWKASDGLHPIQKSFMETGAIQCGYCTPAMVLAAKALLEKTPSPSEEMIRESLSGILCRCTGYLKPVQAIQKVREKICLPT